MTRGFLSIILHAHLPYVKHTQPGDSLEQRWLFQAITESYIPLLRVMRKLAYEEIPYKIAISLSPTLLEMLSDPLLKERYKSHLEDLINLSEKETDRLKYSPQLQGLARMYHEEFKATLKDFRDTFREDLITPWRELEHQGHVEVLTTAATHGYLPLLMRPEAIAAQIKVGIKTFKRFFHHSPKGFWLPECAYTPEAEPHLRREGILYFILETHGVLFATPRPRFGFFAPIITGQDLICFGRDPDCSKQVWSADEGYPGDPSYREFYRDIGYELPLDYLGKALPGSTRVPVGIKYYRVTDRKSSEKDVYNVDAARRMAWEHAGNFMFWRNKEAEYWEKALGRKPMMIAPYDAELFGHWWYEGPLWLENLLRQMASNPEVKTIFPSEYLEIYPVNQRSAPSESSWGYKGYHEVWLEGSNDWIYPHLHYLQDRMVEIARLRRNSSGLLSRGLNQAAREVLLAQASDWPFIMKAGTVPEYAKNRFITHVGRAQKLLKQAEEGAIDPVFLKNIEVSDSLFPDIDFKDFILD